MQTTFLPDSDTPVPKKTQYLIWIPRILLFTLAYVIWRIFWPGLLSYDSINQYGEAFHFRFSNWHPPFLSLLLSLFLAIGGGISTLILCQAFLGLSGIYCLFILIYRLKQTSNSPKCAHLEYKSLLATLLLCSPLTPTIFYLVTFWKDVWIAFSLLWILIFFIRSINLGNNTSYSWYLNLALLILSSICFSLARKNSLLLDPFIATLPIFSISQRFRISKLKKLFIYISILIPLISSQHLLVRGLNAAIINQQNVLLTLDLLSVAKLQPAALEQMPYTKSNILAENWRDLFVIGECRSMKYLSDQRFIKKDYFTIQQNPELEKEYLNTLKTMPLLILKVKLLSFKYLLFKPIRFYYPLIKENSFGLELNKTHIQTRAKIYSFVNTVYENPWANLLSNHLVWLILVLLALIQKLILLYTKKNSELQYEALILIFSLLCYLVYIPASIASDYRYLFPATLLAQVYFLCNFFYLLDNFSKNRKLKAS